MATAATEHARREQAYRDFCNLEIEGINPNPNALYEFYRDKNREHPELRASIPTTNRSTVYEWAREDRWKERYAEKKLLDADLKAEKYEAIRENSYARLVGLQHLALEALADLAANAKDGKVRLQAAESIFDRTGLGRIQARPTKNVTENPDAKDADVLPENATDAEVEAWIVRHSGSSMNA